MVRFSRFTHIYESDNIVALYHSLRMKPVYLTPVVYKNLQEWLAGSFYNKGNEPPESIRNEVMELIHFKILTQTKDEDDLVLEYVKSKIPQPAINVCYIILSDQCNLACRYCFLGNNDIEKRGRFLSGNMSKTTADKAIDFFIHQIKTSGINTRGNKPILIFYGGEPLMNFSTLVYIASRINSLRQYEDCIKNLEMSVITNGVLLNEKMITQLQELQVAVAISIDGFTEESNKLRVDLNGRTVFSRVLQALNRCKANGLSVSLSVTLTEETIKDKYSILDLIDIYGITSLGFNILMSDDNFVLPQSYNESAAQFIIDEFVELRNRGVYEDRMMRKLKAFAKAQVYFSDCAATAGGQIVIAPDGSVGICHGCLADKKYFISHVDDIEFVAVTDKHFIEWSQLTPVNHEECHSCPALGICGGGCPVNAMHLKSENTIHSIDERFCAHSMKVLEFLIWDLYRVITERTKENV